MRNPLRSTLAGKHVAVACARIAAILALIAVAAAPCGSQSAFELQGFFRDRVGLTESQITALRWGAPVAKLLRSRIPDELFVWGAVFIHAQPESYAKFATDYDRLRTLPEFLAIRKISDPPQLADLDGFAFDAEDVKSLKGCKPGDCDIQMPETSIERARQTIDWGSPNAAAQVNRRLQESALERLLAYQREGNAALGVYNDKREPTEVPAQFKFMLSYSTALPEYLPEFHRYLLDYPKARPANAEDSFYWARVKFGLKPTLRVVHVITLRGSKPGEPAFAIAEKQLYASHYFATALDLSFCIRGVDEAKRPGFYLLKMMGSEQSGLTGIKGSIVRKVATGRSVTSLEKSLLSIRNTLEQSPPR